MPLTAGPALAEALDPTDDPFRTAVSLALWVTWLVALVSALVPRPLTLTAVRVIMPALPAAAVWAVLATPSPSWRDALALTSGALVTALALSAPVGERFVDGASYGPERRFPLRPPGLLACGPIELAWAAAVAGAATGPLLGLVGEILPGAIATAVGWPVAVVALRALHSLGRRCVVFVPAGFVIVDPLAVADSVLLPRQLVARLGVATTDGEGLDLTVGALGLALEARLSQPQEVALATRRGGRPDMAGTSSLLFSPSRPGELLAEADERGFAVSR